MENNHEVSLVSIQLRIADDFLRDVLSIAIEGGVNYWARVKVLESVKTLGAAVVPESVKGSYDEPVTVLLIEKEPSTAEGVLEKRVGLPELRAACVRLLERKEPTKGLPHQRYGDNLFTAIAADDACNIDADDADVLVQLAAFGEVVYG